MIDEFELFRARAYGLRDDGDDKSTDDATSGSGSQRRTCNALYYAAVLTGGISYGSCSSVRPVRGPKFLTGKTRRRKPKLL